MKRITMMGLALLFSLFLTIPVQADDTGFIRDSLGLITSYEEEDLETQASQIAEKHHFQVFFATVDGGVVDLEKDASNLYQTQAGESDGVLLVVSADKSQWKLYYGGQGESMLQAEEEDLLWHAFDKENTWSKGIQSYLNTVKSKFEKPALVVDQAYLLDYQEVSKLSTKLTEISQRQGLDVVVLTVPSLYGESPQDYADNFFDFNGYGQGPDHDGVLLLINMEERDWHISTTGYGIYAITDAGLEYMSERFLKHLSSGNYAQAFNTYADLVDDFVTQAKTGKPYDVDNLPKEPFSLLWLPASGLLGFAVAWLVTTLLKGQLQSVQPRFDAREYMRNDSFALTKSQDLFLYRNVSRQARPKPTSSSSGFKGGGGSSSHRSSSGRSHGGGGGKF